MMTIIRTFFSCPLDFPPAARFGLMHMIGTNLCVWLHVLIQETKHQITILVNPNITNTKVTPDLMIEALSEDYLDTLSGDPVGNTFETVTHKIQRRSIVDHETTTHGECRRSNVMGQLVQDASQFLFPCTIEYSLICAAILYMMWKHTDTER